jgi:hypothetical protein
LGKSKKQPSLLTQYNIENKKRELKDIAKKLKRDLSYSEQIKILLPNFDFSNHNGKPIKRHGITYKDGNLKDWFDAKQTHKGLTGGIGSGKTFAVCAKAILLSYHNRPFYHFSLSPTFDNAVETYVEALKELCKNNYLSYDWIASNNLFIIHWGSKEIDDARILIHGQDSDYLSVNAASGDLNEPFRISEEAFDDWWDRIRLSQKKVDAYFKEHNIEPRTIMRCRVWGGTAIPESMQWGFEYFEKDKMVSKDFYKDTIITYGNKYLDEDYIKGQEKHYPTKKEREVRLLGRCIRLAKGQAAYDTFDRIKNVDSIMKYSLPESTELGLSFDFNVNPMSCLLGAIYENKMRSIEEFQIENSQTREMSKLVIHRMKEKGYLIKDEYGYWVTKFGKSLIITGDSTGESRSTKSVENDYQIILDVFENVYTVKIQIVLNYSMDSKGEIHYFNPPIRDTRNDVCEMFANESLIINANCDGVIKAMEMTPWKEGGQGFTIDENKYKFSHLSPCLRYFVHNLQELVKASSSRGESLMSFESREEREPEETTMRRMGLRKGDRLN